MRRFLLVLLLMPALIGFPTSQASANGEASFSFNDVLYWTSDWFTDQPAYSGVSCALNPDKLWPCVYDVFLDGRKLEYRPYSEYLALRDAPSSPDSVHPQKRYVTVGGQGVGFLCWSPTWAPRTPKPQVPLNELCSYREYNVSIPGIVPDLSPEELPQLTLTVRKVKGTHPASHFGFLHASGPVHEFVPTSDTNEFATVTMSPGLVVGANGGFSPNLHTSLEQPEYAGSNGQWTYTVFLATLKVTGPSFPDTGFEMLPESRGSWQATNASNWGFYGDYQKPGYAIRLAGPHFKYKANESDPDELNTAWFMAYFPKNFLQSQFGITPQQANETNMEVIRSVGRNPTQLPSTFTPFGSGLVVETTGITFSKPAITVRRRIDINQRRKVTRETLIGAAGVPTRYRKTARISSSPCRSSKKNCVSSRGIVTFRKTGRYVFQVSYMAKDARKRDIQRTTSVTVRVR